MEILVPISIGEFYDKISILEIKREKIYDENKLVNITNELELLNKIFEKNLAINNELFYKLRKINKDLWDVEDKENPKLIIGIDEKYYRPSEVDLLLADPSKAKEKLGWQPKTTFKELVKIMMKNELK